MNHIVPIDWSMIGLAIVLGIVVLIVNASLYASSDSLLT